MTEFRTFCHISEYGEPGYRQLHRMIASSSPLVLWAPSSTLLSAPTCRVEPREFVDFVRKGHVRVIAREEWLLSESTRNDHPWDGAAWTPSVDNELKKFAEADQDVEASKRRVTVAPPELGKTWAKGHVDENGDLVAKVAKVLKRSQPEKHIPIGVLETARRYDNDPLRTVQHILRDVRNHGDAIALSGAQAPFFLSPQDSQFLRWIDSAVESPSPPPAAQRNLDHAALAAQLLALLRTMEMCGGATDLRRFVGSAEHQELADWYASICQCVALERPKSLEDKVSRELNRTLEQGRLQNKFRSWISRKTRPRFSRSAWPRRSPGRSSTVPACCRWPECCSGGFRSARACCDAWGTCPRSTPARSGPSSTVSGTRLPPGGSSGCAKPWTWRPRIDLKGS